VPTPGKNFPGQKGFPTPNSTPDNTVRRIFVVPNSDEWLGLLEGAAQVLLDEWRYYDWGAMTPAEAASAFNSVVLASYTNVCPNVPNSVPRILRLNPDTGAVEEVGDDGEWVPATDPYAIPPPPPREGSDAICLAATNAANVIQLLYENLTDSAGAALTLAEAIAAFVAACLELIGVAAAAVAGALIALFAAIFAVVFATAQFLLADLWDENFTKQMVCFLVDCASDDAGVITFDFNCFLNALAQGTNAFDLTSDQIRLYVQVTYILQFLGGSDALNAAGGTTAITTADCSDCAPTCALVVDFSDPGLYSFYERFPGIDSSLDESFGHPAPSALSGFGLDGAVPAFSVDVEIDLGAVVTVTDVIFEYFYQRNDAPGVYLYVAFLDEAHVEMSRQDASVETEEMVWHTFEAFSSVADVRYLRVGAGGENEALTDASKAWLDNVCVQF